MVTKNCLVGHVRSAMLSKCLASVGVVPLPDHLVIVLSEKGISCHFDLGTDWPVRPLMQDDKAVFHQFPLSLPCNLHGPLSTCGMRSQHLGGVWLGFKFLLHTVHSTRMTLKPTVFETLLFLMLETQ